MQMMQRMMPSGMVPDGKTPLTSWEEVSRKKSKEDLDMHAWCEEKHAEGKTIHDFSDVQLLQHQRLISFKTYTGKIKRVPFSKELQEKVQTYTQKLWELEKERNTPPLIVIRS